MRTQTYTNHTRWVPGFHFLLAGLILAAFAGSVVNVILTHERGESIYDPLLLLIAFAALAMLFYYARLFALRAQDRAIRAEENFRHYLLTGQPLDSRLTMHQIIALRFASDGELPALAQRAANEHLSNKDIKQAITTWRGDHHRA